MKIKNLKNKIKINELNGTCDVGKQEVRPVETGDMESLMYRWCVK